MEFITEHTLKFVLGTVLTGITLSIKMLYKRILKETEEQKAMREALLAILHDRLYTLCEQYIQENEITTDALNNLKYIYNSYHVLGGNGTGRALYKRCVNLPMKK